MPTKHAQLLAVGAAVVAELVLGAFLVMRGGGTPANPNPYRVGDGFPVPPPCSLIDRALVSRLIGSDDHQLTYDNLSRQEPKRYSNIANVTFEIDNLDVRVDYQYPTRGDRFMPPPSPSIVPSTRR